MIMRARRSPGPGLWPRSPANQRILLRAPPMSLLRAPPVGLLPDPRPDLPPAPRADLPPTSSWLTT